jgi:hypothetical protein
VHFIEHNEELLKHFDADQLPVSLGGSNTFQPEGLSLGIERLRQVPKSSPPAPEQQ